MRLNLLSHYASQLMLMSSSSITYRATDRILIFIINAETKIHLLKPFHSFSTLNIFPFK